MNSEERKRALRAAVHDKLARDYPEHGRDWACIDNAKTLAMWGIIDSLVDECARASCDLAEIADLLDGTFEPMPHGTDEGERTYVECAYLIAKRRRTPLEVIEDVTELLKAMHYDATVEYPGCIAILWNGVLYKWGTVNETWMADMYHPQDTNEFGCVKTDVPSNCIDVDSIVKAITTRLQTIGISAEEHAG